MLVQNSQNAKIRRPETGQSQMAFSSSQNPVLPVADPPRNEERHRLLKGYEKLSQGSAMTKRGANAAISYMSCAGTFFLTSSPHSFLLLLLLASI